MTTSLSGGLLRVTPSTRTGEHKRCRALFRASASLAALFLLLSVTNAGALTRAEAIEKAIQVIVPATLDHNVTAYMGMAPLADGTKLRPWRPHAGLPDRERVLSGPKWFCWIDDQPQGFFSHKTRYVLIDDATGAVDVYIEEWWPEIHVGPGPDDYQSLFMTDAEWEDPDIVIFSFVHTEPIPGP